MMTIFRRRPFGLHFLMLLLNIILFATGFSQSASACTCAQTSPVCELVVRSKAIFLGESVELVTDPKTGAEFYRFRVEQTYKGLPPDTKEVQVYAGGLCGREYPTGKRYIIFGNNEAKQPLAVMSGMCSGSRLADRNQADIDFLENYVKGKTETAVFGRVVQGGTFYSQTDKDEIAPLGGAEVVMENNDHRFVAVTQPDGSYRFSGVPAGKYRLSAKIESYTLDKPYEDVTVEGSGCNEVFFLMKAHCSIVGVLLDEKGEPVAKERVEILRRNPGGEWYYTPRMWRTTDSTGAFEFADIDSGEYLLGYEIWGGYPSDNSAYPTVYHPSAGEIASAQIINLAPGHTLNGLKIKLLPPHTKRQVTIRVIMPDGSLPGKNLLQVFSKSGGLLKNLQGENSAGGVVLFTAYQEREYEFRARYWVDNLNTGTPVFTKRLLVAEPVKLAPGKEAAEVTLMLSREIKAGDKY